MHIHGFKCAGTTLATLLAYNFGNAFRCVESDKPSRRLPWSQIVGHHALVDVQAVSSHTVTVPPRVSNALVIGLVRKPSDRLISAWRFYQKQSGQLDFPFSGYLRRQKMLKNYQSRLYSPQFCEMHSELWGQHFHRLQFGHGYFLGTVDRYSESLVIIKHLLNQRGIEFRAFVAMENSGTTRKTEVSPDVPIPDDYVNVDNLLYRRCNELIDAFKQIIPSFDTKLNEIENADRPVNQFRSLVSPESFLHISVSRNSQ